MEMRVTDPSNMTATAGIFATYPEAYLSAQQGFVDQIVGTMMLVLPLMALTDKRNANIPEFLVPLFAGMAVFAIGTSYGMNCGYGINPARDLGPRILTAMAGWGVEAFSYRHYNWFWIPILGPYIGATLGAFIYLLLIELHWGESDGDESDVKYDVQQREPNTGADNEGLGENAAFESGIESSSKL